MQSKQERENSEEVRLEVSTASTWALSPELRSSGIRNRVVEKKREDKGVSTSGDSIGGSYRKRNREKTGMTVIWSAGIRMGQGAMQVL